MQTCVLVWTGQSYSTS
uniref:Uncharacterized protein n=1 Tax=Arundo donax TaxID=35708 RepID=A0A0A8XXX6_ARUDO